MLNKLAFTTSLITLILGIQAIATSPARAEFLAEFTPQQEIEPTTNQAGEVQQLQRQQTQIQQEIESIEQNLEVEESQAIADRETIRELQAQKAKLIAQQKELAQQIDANQGEVETSQKKVPKPAMVIGVLTFSAIATSSLLTGKQEQEVTHSRH